MPTGGATSEPIEEGPHRFGRLGVRDDAPVDDPEFLDVSPGSRRITAERRVRLGDVTPSGRLRLDAVARYLQDIAADDVDDAGVEGSWVTRRVVLRLGALPPYGTPLTVETFCTGAGPRWAERRTNLLVGDRPAVEARAIWVFLNRDGGTAPLPPGFFEHYGHAADRRVSGRLQLGPPPSGASRRAWPLRRSDFDVLDHVNNAIALAAVEDELASRPARQAERRLSDVQIEYRAPIDPGDAPTLVASWSDDALGCWLCVGDEVRVAARVGW